MVCCLVTACRTTCLYGVSYSRASPRLFVGVTSSVSAQTAPPRGANLLYAQSQGGALRACPELPTAESFRLSLKILYFVHCAVYYLREEPCIMCVFRFLNSCDAFIAAASFSKMPNTAAPEPVIDAYMDPEL